MFPAVRVVVAASIVATLTAQGSDLSYSDRGNRFEGHRKIEIAGPAFEALSFVRGRGLRQLPSPQTLNVRFFVAKPTKVFLTALELDTTTQYYMRAKQTEWPSGWNAFGPWRTADVLDRLSVPLTNVGVIAYVGDDRAGSGELAPVSFSSGAATTFEFIFRVRYDLESASFRVERSAANRAVRSGAIGRAPAQTATVIQFDLGTEPRGSFVLTVDCLYEGRGGGPQRSFTFYYEP